MEKAVELTPLDYISHGLKWIALVILSPLLLLGVVVGGLGWIMHKLGCTISKEEGDSNYGDW